MGTRKKSKALAKFGQEEVTLLKNDVEALNYLTNIYKDDVKAVVSSAGNKETLLKGLGFEEIDLKDYDKEMLYKGFLSVKHKEIYYIPGKYYVVDVTTGEPLILNGQHVESKDKGPLLSWLQKSLILANTEGTGDLANISSRKFKISRDIIITEPGFHTHISELKNSKNYKIKGWSY